MRTTQSWWPSACCTPPVTDCGLAEAYHKTINHKLAYHKMINHKLPFYVSRKALCFFAGASTPDLERSSCCGAFQQQQRHGLELGREKRQARSGVSASSSSREETAPAAPRRIFTSVQKTSNHHYLETRYRQQSKSEATGGFLILAEVG